MKSSKKPLKEPTFPSQDEARRSNVLMEQMLSKFNTFGEVQSHIVERLDRMEPDLHAVKEDVAVLKSAVRSQGGLLRGHSDAIHANTEAIRAMHSDLKNINQRLEVVEAKVAS